MTTTEHLPADTTGIARAAEILAGGGLVAFPTETVYGLGADARNGRAVARVFAAKRRPVFNPLIVHVADMAAAEEFAAFNATARRLAASFWPGPLSLVLPRHPQAGLSDLVTAGLDTVALRIPAHPLARRLLRAFGGPVAAPSANLSGQISPTTAAHVLHGLSGRIDAVLDGGSSAVGLESTILLPHEHEVCLLRAGGVALEAIEQSLSRRLLRPQDPDTPQSPGQMASHYAPRATLRPNASDHQKDEVLLGFGPDTHHADMNLSESADLAEAAANLFAFLRLTDELAAQRGQSRIAVSPIPDHGLGLAINDRLRRAAAPRGPTRKTSA
jgi:L-threonylcarbamoyladenylate synthase